MVIAKTDYTLTEEELIDESEYYEEGSIDTADPVITYKGNNGLINAAAFETESYLYAISCEWGEDGSGMTEEELLGVVNSLLGREEPEPEEAPENADGAVPENTEAAPAENAEVPADYAAPPADPNAEAPVTEYVDPALADYAEAPADPYAEAPVQE